MCNAHPLIFLCAVGALLMHKARLAREQPGGLPKKTAVTILGRQPGSNIWALGPLMFIDELTGKDN